MTGDPAQQRGSVRCRLGNRARRARGRRRGAVTTVQLVALLPLLIGGLFALIEFGMILNAQQRLKSATVSACRTAALSCDDTDVQAAAVQSEAMRVLEKDSLIRDCQLTCELGVHTGDPVTVEISVPMKSAAPNLLAIIGVSLEGREMVAKTTMCKE